MDAYTLFSLIVLILWGSFLFALIYCGRIYEGYRGEAFSKMRRIRIAVYLIPLILSVLFVIFLRERTDLFFGSVWILIIGIGAMSWLLLFDAFESRKVKLSRTEQKR